MVCVGIDVAKDKHDCCILDSEGTTLVDCSMMVESIFMHRLTTPKIPNCLSISN